MALTVRPSSDSRWDLVALGEVMLRLDPGDERIQSARQFRAWEGGGEYNVARGLSRCFGASTTIVTAFADNPVGRLIEDLIRQGGVDRSHGPQRPELHGARLWRARGGRKLGPGQHGGVPADRRGRGLGGDLRR